MPTFGFSAFLKLACLNPRPSRTEIRKRLGSSTGGYDFHRSLRLRIARHMVDDIPMDEVLSSVSEISRAPEQRSARNGLERLNAWRRDNPGPILSYAPVSYESPGGLYKVGFNPDFGLNIGGQGVAIHVWNTARPDLVPRMAYAALSLIAPQYEGQNNAPDDLGVLSLPDMKLYRLSDAGRYAGLGPGLAERLEDLMREVQNSLDQPSGEPPEDRPNGP